MSVDITINRSTAVKVTRTLYRDNEDCHDWDLYKLTFEHGGEYDEGGTVVIDLHCKPGEDIGLGALVEVSADE